MAVTAFPGSPDHTLLNVARLFTRLEHNLLSPGADRRALQQSEYQRMRVNKNVEYARSLLTQLERSLPQLKLLDHKHEVQAEIARDRQLLKRIQTLLDEEEAKAETRQDDDDNEVDNDEWKELFSKPVSQDVAPISQPTDQRATTKSLGTQLEVTESSNAQSTTTIPTTTTQPKPTSTLPPISTPTPPTLRNRHNNAPNTATDKANATGSNAKLHDTERELDTHRMEQDDLTNSLLALATQLKTSSKAFQSSLENEKSVLERASSGMDRTSANMEAAGKKMGTLRQMSEGKGLWGRMMLYAWIFALCIIAILIVLFLPNLRYGRWISSKLEPRWGWPLGSH